jgi:hypothetical protein
MSGPWILRTWVTISRKIVGTWFNSFTDVNNQFRRDDGCLGEVLMKNASGSFFPPSQSKKHYLGLAIWRWFILHLLVFHVFVLYVLIYFLFDPFLIHFFILAYSHFIVLGGSIIACRFIQRHIVALESDIDCLHVQPPPHS